MTKYVISGELLVEILNVMQKLIEAKNMFVGT